MKSEIEVRKFLLGVEATKPALKKLGVQSTDFAIVVLKWVLDEPQKVSGVLNIVEKK
jgi:hypothetical protein